MCGVTVFWLARVGNELACRPPATFLEITFVFEAACT